MKVLFDLDECVAHKRGSKLVVWPGSAGLVAAESLLCSTNTEIAPEIKCGFFAISELLRPNGVECESFV